MIKKMKMKIKIDIWGRAHAWVRPRSVSILAYIGRVKRIGGKFKKVTLPFLIGCVLILIPVVIALFRHPSPTQAIWAPTLGTWSQRRQLNVVNSSSATLHANTTIAVTVDTKSLIGQGKLKSDCSDLRVVYQPSDTTNTELTRHLVYPSGGTCGSSTATRVYFSLQADLASAGTR